MTITRPDMAFEMGIRVEGAETARQRVVDMANRVDDFSPVWPEVKDVVQRHSDKWLSSSGEGSFPPLAPSTIAKGNRRSNRPLDKTGTGWDSLVGDTTFTIFTHTSTRCEIGTAADWMHWHMFPRKHMPARPPVKITEQLKSDVKHVLMGHVRGAQAALL